MLDIIYHFLVSELSCYGVSQNRMAEKPIIITGTFDFLEKGDTIEMMASHFQMFSSFSSKYKVPVLNNSFSLELPNANHPVYINVLFPKEKRQYSLTNLLVEPGDSISFSLQPDCQNDDNRCVRLSGRGFEKLTCQRELARMWIALYNERFKSISDFKPSKENFQWLDSIFYERMKVLDRYKDKVSPGAYALMKIELLAGTEKSKSYSLINNLFEKNTRKFLPDLKGYHDPLWEALNSNEIVESGLPEFSMLYSDCIIKQYIVDSCFIPNKPFKFGDAYFYLKKNFSGTLREKLIAHLFYDNRNGRPGASYYRQFSNNELDGQPYIKDALSYFKDESYRQILKGLEGGSAEGNPAFNFSLTDTNGETKRLPDFKNKVILMDFWYTGCGNCVKLHPHLEKIQSEVNDQDFVFISVSIDKNKAQWIKSIKGGKYTSMDNVNLYTSGNGSDDPLIKHYNITGYPTLLLIDKEGKHLDVGLDPRVDGGKDLAARIKEALK